MRTVAAALVGVSIVAAGVAAQSGDRTAHLAQALTLRANARPEQPDPEIAAAVSQLVTIASPAILGQLPYSTAEQLETAEARLAAILDDAKGPRAIAARGLEALARRNRKLGQLSNDTLALLKKGAAWQLPAMSKPADEAIARESFAALMAAGVVDAKLIEEALDETSALYRRLGALALFGTGATLTDADRTRLVRVALDDRDWTVRYDALRAWVRRETERNGCGPIADALSDSSLHLVLAAIDALGDRCVAGRGSRASDCPADQRAAHAAGHRVLASRGARSGRRGEAGARPRGDDNPGVQNPQRLAGPDVCGQGGGAAQGRVHAREAGL
jgi:hypothetical protein